MYEQWELWGHYLRPLQGLLTVLQYTIYGFSVMYTMCEWAKLDA